jgi:hypothetical protein
MSTKYLHRDVSFILKFRGKSSAHSFFKFNKDFVHLLILAEHSNFVDFNNEHFNAIRYLQFVIENKFVAASLQSTMR